jgi:hypothetical protein
MLAVMGVRSSFCVGVCLLGRGGVKEAKSPFRITSGNKGKGWLVFDGSPQLSQMRTFPVCTVLIPFLRCEV